MTKQRSALNMEDLDPPTRKGTREEAEELAHAAIFHRRAKKRERDVAIIFRTTMEWRAELDALRDLLSLGQPKVTISETMEMALAALRARLNAGKRK